MSRESSPSGAHAGVVPLTARHPADTLVPTDSTAPSFRAFEANEPRPRKRPRGGVNIPAACNTCRKRKSKCTGQRPACSFCAERDLECVYDTELPGETRGRALRRRQGDLEAENTTLIAENATYAQLVDFLRHASPSKAQEAVQLLRSGLETQNVLSQVQGVDLLNQLSLASPEDTHYRYEFPLIGHFPSHILEHPNNPYLRSMLYEGTIAALPGNRIPESAKFPPALQQRPMYLVPYHAAVVVDPRLDQVTARWTNVTSSDELVRKLLKIYFLHEYPNIPLFQKDLFLDDMVSGKPRYCSSLLVNAVLGAACHGQIAESRRAHFWDPDTLGYRFTAEAKRLWELEMRERPRLTTIQAGGIMFASIGLDGMETISQPYLLSSIALAEQLHLFDVQPASISPRRRVARIVTAWLLFNLQSVHCFNFLKSPIMPRPPREPAQPWYFGDIQVLYPRTKHPVATGLGDTLKSHCDYHAILSSLLERLEPGTAPITFEEAEAFRDRLDAWFDTMPRPLSSREIVHPAQIKLHLGYYNVIMAIFMPFLSGDDKQKTPANSEIQREATYLVRNANIMLETLLRLYYLRHGYEYVDGLMIIWHSILGWSAIKDLAALDPVSEANVHRMALSNLLLSLKAIHEQGRSWNLCKAVYAAMRNAANPEHLRLVQEDGELTVDEQRERATMLATHTSTAWPLHIVSIGDLDKKGGGLDELVRKLISSSLEDESSGSEGSSSMERGE